MKLTFLLFLFYAGSCMAQLPEDIGSPPVFIPNTLPTHPFGIYLLRNEADFKLRAPAASTLDLMVSSGNVWVPAVTAYFPSAQADRSYLSRYPWHEREHRYDPAESPSKAMRLHADGVIRRYQLRLSLPLAVRQELQVSLRGFSLDGGKQPHSTISSDRFIEWFHSNIAGGEDPFGRKHYGFNQTSIDYTDRGGRRLVLRAGDAGLTGLDAAYRYYPESLSLLRGNLTLTLAGRAGISLTRVNPSLDLGLGSTLQWRRQVTRRSSLRIGANAGLVTRQLTAPQQALELTDRRIGWSGNLLMGWTIRFTPSSYLAVLTTCYAHGTYFRPRAYSYAVLTGERVTTHWPYAVSHLFRPLVGNNLVLSYGRGDYALAAYLREDILVDNAPDIQVGLGLRRHLGRR